MGVGAGRDRRTAYAKGLDIDRRGCRSRWRLDGRGRGRRLGGDCRWLLRRACQGSHAQANEQACQSKEGQRHDHDLLSLGIVMRIYVWSGRWCQLWHRRMALSLLCSFKLPSSCAHHTMGPTRLVLPSTKPSLNGCFLKKLSCIGEQKEYLRIEDKSGTSPKSCATS